MWYLIGSGWGNGFGFVLGKGDRIIMQCAAYSIIIFKNTIFSVIIYGIVQYLQT